MEGQRAGKLTCGGLAAKEKWYVFSFSDMVVKLSYMSDRSQASLNIKLFCLTVYFPVETPRTPSHAMRR